MGFLTRKLLTIAPIAIGGLIAILFFKKAFASSFSEAGSSLGGGTQSIGQGLGTGLGSIGTGVSTFGQGLGTGIAGLLNPIYTLIDIGSKLGLNNTSDSGSTKSQERVSGQPRTTSGGSRITFSDGNAVNLPVKLSPEAIKFYANVGTKVS
jgi:hypothetical protein